MAKIEEEEKLTATASGEVVSKMGDKYIWGIFLTLCVISTVEAYSASSREVLTQGIYMPLIKHVCMLALGGMVAYFMQLVPYYRYIGWIPVFGIATLVLLAITLTFSEVNGAKRAIPFMGFSLQPSEMAKFGIVLLIAWITAKNQKVEGVKSRGIYFCAGIIALFGGLMVTQGLSNTILLMSISIALLLIAGMSWGQFAQLVCIYLLIGIVLFAGYIGYSALSESKHPDVPEGENIEITSAVSAENSDFKKIFGRFDTWVNRLKAHSDTTPLVKEKIGKANAQEIYSHMAQAHGGIRGVGPGNSRECSRLPLAYIDYVYSIIVEELGYIGGIAVLVLYLWLLARAGSIAWRCKRTLPALIVMGMAVFIVFQALYHICINVGVIPVSGQPLPLISKGGFSIVITGMAFGLMLSVSRTAVQSNKTKEIKAENDQLPTDMQISNPSQK